MNAWSPAFNLCGKVVGKVPGFLGRFDHQNTALSNGTRLAHLIGIELVIGERAFPCPPPSLGCEALQDTRPAAIRFFVSVWVESGKEVRYRAPGSQEVAFGLAVQ